MDDSSRMASLQAHMTANFRAGTLSRAGLVTGAWFVGRLSPTRAPGRHAATVVVATRRGVDGCASAVVRHRGGGVDASWVAAALGSGDGTVERVPPGDVEPEEDGFGGIVGVMDALSGERGDGRRMSRYLVQHALRSLARLRGDAPEATLLSGIDAHLATMGEAVRPFLDTLDQSALEAVRKADAFDVVSDWWPALDATFGPTHGHMEAALREAPGMVATLLQAHADDPEAFRVRAASGGAASVLDEWHARSLPPHVATLHREAAHALASLAPVDWERVGKGLDGHASTGPRHERLLRLLGAMPPHAVPRCEADWGALASVSDTLAAAVQRDLAAATPGSGEAWTDWAARLREAGDGEPADRVPDLGRMSFTLCTQVAWPAVRDLPGASLRVTAEMAHEALFSRLDLPGRLAMLARWRADPRASRVPDSRRPGDWDGYLAEPWASMGPEDWRRAMAARLA